MTIKQSVEDVVRNAFVGKKFISSQFKKTGEFLYDIYDEETDVKAEDIIGKRELSAKIGRELYLVKENGKLEDWIDDARR